MGYMPIPMVGGSSDSTGDDVPATTNFPSDSIPGPMIYPDVTSSTNSFPTSNSNPPSSSSPNGSQGELNQWGESPFLSDEEANISSGEDSSSGIFDKLNEWFNGD